LRLRASSCRRRSRSPIHEPPAVEAEHIEQDVDDTDVVPAHQHALAHRREVRVPFVVERDEFAVEDPEHRERCELG
jgi:hypothetical protein